MKALNRHCVAGAIAVGLIGLATSAFADPIIPSPTIISGDKTFNNFICTAVLDGVSVSCLNYGIGVTAHTSGPPDPTTGDFGIMIQGSLLAAAGHVLDIAINYNAFINSGSARFHDASMFYDGNFITNVSEHIYDEDPGVNFGKLIGFLQVSQPGPFSADIPLSINATNILVVKDIGLNCTAGLELVACSNPATISIIHQNFSQIPEPASLLLLGFGLVGLGWFGRRRGNRA